MIEARSNSMKSRLISAFAILVGLSITIALVLGQSRVPPAIASSLPLAWLTGVRLHSMAPTIQSSTLTSTPASSPTLLIQSDHWQVRYQDADPGGLAWTQWDYDDSTWGYPAAGKGDPLPESIWSPTNFVPAPPQIWYGRHTFILSTLPTTAQFDQICVNNVII